MNHQQAALATRPCPLRLGRGDALLLVDVQRDFMPGGVLPVAGGDRIVPHLNRIIALMSDAALPIYASRDWHPSDHCSFKKQGGTWPAHCVAGTQGARFAEGLHLPTNVVVISKASTPDSEAYSAFQGTPLAPLLLQDHVERLIVAGLATDYCVSQTVQDALAKGWTVCVPTDAVAAVNLHPGDGDRALSEMRKHGAQIISSLQIMAPEPAQPPSIRLASERRPSEKTTS